MDHSYYLTQGQNFMVLHLHWQLNGNILCMVVLCSGTSLKENVVEAVNLAMGKSLADRYEAVHKGIVPKDSFTKQSSDESEEES